METFLDSDTCMKGHVYRLYSGLAIRCCLARCRHPRNFCAPLKSEGIMLELVDVVEAGEVADTSNNRENQTS